MSLRHRRSTRLAAFTAVFAAAGLGGCNLDSYMDPSVAGYWEMYPTSMPILTRLDAIEGEDAAFADATPVTSDDLVPNRLEYQLAPGDFVTVQIYELYNERQWATRTSRVDASGILRVPEVGDVLAAGLTAEGLEESLIELYNDIITVPQVDVEIAESGGFQYTIYGFINGTGLYTLRREDLRLLDALALAGGVSPVVETIYVIRSSPLEDRVLPDFERERGPETGGQAEPTPGGVDIDDLINDFPGGGEDGVSPGVLRQDGEPAIDVDDLQPRGGAPVDIDAVRAGNEGWVYDANAGGWVQRGGGSGGSAESPLIVDRIIEVPVKELLEGDSRYNIVIRPDDRIRVEPPVSGVVYIEGQINRPGPYEIPADGMFTLSRLIASAGGFGALAIPERVDITRIVGENREATIRVNLKAIRNRTEPDVVLKPDDHINIGTNFWATPLAVIRNGFRFTYGFGFLLDRNFGNDVFGAPPSNVGNG